MRTAALTTGRRSAVRAAGLIIGSALALTIWGTIPALADPTPDEVLFQSAELKIYRTLSRGTPVLVLTNVDAEGNFLAARESSGGAPEVSALRPSPGAGATGAPPEPPLSVPAVAGSDEPGRVKVVVHGDGTASPDQKDVEVTTEGTGDTTVIININPPAPPPREVEAPVWSYPVVVGGLPGPFRYPKHQYFLGYGPNTSSPSMFGGLGLNAGNGFGLKTGVPCDKGYDCMFGPTTGAP
jgi:hypothetical protein